MVRDLTAQVKDLTARLQGKSPPSRPSVDIPPAPAKKPTGRKPGGQPGHPPHLKSRLPLELVSNIVAHVPKTCEHCQAALPRVAGAHDPEPTWHQVVELPKVLATVTEHQGHARTCACCGEVTRAAIPAEVLAHSIGPQLTSVIGYLTGDQGMSKRGVEELVEQVFGVPIGLGTVSNLEQEISAALAAAHTEATDAVRDAPVKNVDETGWKENGKKRWLWLAATKLVAVFIIHPWRNRDGVGSVVGPRIQRHFVQRPLGGLQRVAGPIGAAVVLGAFETQLGGDGRTGRNGEENRRSLPGDSETGLRAMAPVPRRRLYTDGVVRPDRSVHRQDGRRHRRRLALPRREDAALLCALGREQTWGLWTFVETEGVEPTNNHGERVLRRAVLWRRRSFGCHSAAGCRFAERILTVATTLRLQRSKRRELPERSHRRLPHW